MEIQEGGRWRFLQDYEHVDLIQNTKATTQGLQYQEKTYASSSPDWLAGVDVWNLGLKLPCISDVPFLTQMWLIRMTGCWQWQLTALGNGVCS